MSLIINMLKDLERREIRSKEVPHLVFNHALQKKHYIPSHKILLIGLFSTIFLALVILLLTHQHTAHLAKMLPAPKLAKQSEILPLTKSNWVKPVQVTGITMQVKDNITEISFLLNHAALYRLVSDDMHNHLALIVDHAQLQAELPPANRLNTAISGISAQNSHGDVKFDLALLPGATIKYVNLNDENKNPELVVAIAYDAPAQDNLPNSPRSPMVKTPVMQSLLTQQYQSALAEVENGHYQPAIQHLASLLNIEPNFNEARVSLTALLIDQGDQQKANQIISAGLRIAPNNVPFVELKARILALQGNAKKALELLQTVSPPMAENPDYHAFIAALYEQTNDPSAAANLYKQLLSVDSQNGNWWFGLGLALEKLDKPGDAKTAYTHAVSEGHLNPESIAYLHKRLRELDEANDANV